jgi:hypothetical protein
MHDENPIADHWGKGDVYGLILEALRRAGKDPDALTLEDLAPVDHYHARGFPATVELADRLTTIFSTLVAALVAQHVTSRRGFGAKSAVSTSLRPLWTQQQSSPRWLTW